MSRDSFSTRTKSFLGRCLRTLPALGLLLVLAQPGTAQDPDNKLNLFQRYFANNLFIKSDGKGVRGTGAQNIDPNHPTLSLAKATIDLTGQVPPNSDILAAFAYWETFEKTGFASSSVVYLRDPEGTSQYLQPVNPYPTGTGILNLADSPPIYGKPL